MGTSRDEPFHQSGVFSYCRPPTAHCLLLHARPETRTRKSTLGVSRDLRFHQSGRPSPANAAGPGVRSCAGSGAGRSVTRTRSDSRITRPAHPRGTRKANDRAGNNDGSGDPRRTPRATTSSRSHAGIGWIARCSWVVVPSRHRPRRLLRNRLPAPAGSGVAYAGEYGGGWRGLTEFLCAMRVPSGALRNRRLPPAAIKQNPRPPHAGGGASGDAPDRAPLHDGKPKEPAHRSLDARARF